MAEFQSTDAKVLLIQLEEVLLSGHKLLLQIDQLAVNGSSKLKRRAEKEIKFLKQLTPTNIKKEHVSCTNLIHCQAITDCLLNELETSSVCELLKSFSYDDEYGEKKRIIVDIVAANNTRWIKVVARNPKALHLLSLGAGGYGQRTMLDHAVEYMICAQQNPALFKIPQVVFSFTNGITTSLATYLEQKGITVQGQRLPVPLSIQDIPNDNTDETDDYQINRMEDIEKVNLDITAMIAYVSSLTNGRCDFRFKGPVLDQQAEWERERPVKPVLDKIFQGKDLYCCEWALNDFLSIVNTIGGNIERENTEQLLKRVKVVPDNPSPKAQLLQSGGKITPRSITIFGTGDSLQAVTVTANVHFIQAAQSQGVRFATFICEARALTESKEDTATPLEK